MFNYLSFKYTPLVKLAKNLLVEEELSYRLIDSGYPIVTMIFGMYF